MSKIESITATVPVTGQAYTDLRPTISADSIEEYREMLAEVGRLAGNDAFVQRMTKNRSGKEKICTDDGCLYFDKAAHTYEDEDGNIFQSGSVWAGQFEKPFDAQAIAPKVAEKRLTTPEQVVAGWDMKGEVSTMYGSAVHKALECGIKYGEVPNNPHLATLVQTYLDMTHNDDQVSEVFVANMEHKMCGVIDVLVNKGDKHVIVRDFKGLALDTPIPTPTGFTTMGEIKIGDELYDDEGNVTKVTEKSEIHHKKCYKLEFSSGAPVIADYDHRWVTLDYEGRAHKLTKRKIMTTEEIANSTKPVRIPLNQGIDGKEKELPVDPYVLGVWLGDGKRGSGQITTSNPDIWDEILERGYKIGPIHNVRRKENCEDRSVYGLVGQLKKAGVCYKKHIPEIYMRASRQQRLDLLAGLLDTDGSFNKARTEVTICTTQDWWEEALRELVGSLGGKVTVCDYVTTGFGKKWKAKQMRIMTLFNPFKAKEVSWMEGHSRLTGGPSEKGRNICQTKRTFEYVTSCVSVETVPTQCIQVSSPRHTYLFGKDFHVTHNTGDIYKKITLTPRAKELWPDLPSKLISIYQLQLSFYAYILANRGYRVESLEIYAESAEAWQVVKLPVLNIREAL